MRNKMLVCTLRWEFRDTRDRDVECMLNFRANEQDLCSGLRVMRCELRFGLTSILCSDLFLIYMSNGEFDLDQTSRQMMLYKLK